MTGPEMKFEVAMRVFAARFNTREKVKADKAAHLAWDAAEVFVEELKKGGWDAVELLD